MKKKLILVSIVLVIIAIWGINALRKQNALEECKVTAETLCTDYRIENFAIDISYSQKYDEYDVYLLKVDGTYDDLPIEEIYQFVKKIDSIMIDYDETLLLTRVKLNNKVYKLASLNSNELKCDNTVVYTYVSDEDKQIMNGYKDTLPFVGMREKYLEYTLLGKADSIEKCRDFNALQKRAKHKTYEWEATNEHGWYKITVSYRMHRSHRFDDYEDLPDDNGYVSNITYTDANGRIQTENYVDTIK